jgi:multidrug transporter EmrE-like cation transporter
MMTPSKSASRLSLALIWAGLVVCDSAAQLLFKSAAVRLAEPAPTLAWVAMVAQSWRVWSAVACLILTFGLWMLVLRRAKLSTAFPVTALTFVGVVGGSWWFFGEMIAPVQYAGIALIVAGVAAIKPLDA